MPDSSLPNAMPGKWPTVTSTCGNSWASTRFRIGRNLLTGIRLTTLKCSIILVTRRACYACVSARATSGLGCATFSIFRCLKAYPFHMLIVGPTVPSVARCSVSGESLRTSFEIGELLACADPAIAYFVVQSEQCAGENLLEAIPHRGHKVLNPLRSCSRPDEGALLYLPGEKV